MRGRSAWRLSIKVSNTGTVAGAEVVQLYVGTVPVESGEPVRQLKNFQKVFIQPGSSTVVQLNLTPRDVSRWDRRSHAWVVRRGSWVAYVGPSSGDLPLTVRFSNDQRVRPTAARQRR